LTPPTSEAKRATTRLTDPALVGGLREIFSENADFVWSALRRLGVQEADVDDALQEVFLVVYRKLENYEERGLIRSWLFAISRQVASHYRRGQQRTQRREEGVVTSSSPSDPHELVARREAAHMVTSFLQELNADQREVFYLADIEGLTAPEIAAALGVKLNTVYGRLRLARKRFERALRIRRGDRA